jgi:hypothetical protein
VELGAHQRARQSKRHPDRRSTTINSWLTQISLALSSRRDNHPLAATAEMAILIVAVFPSRLSRYSLLEAVKLGDTPPDHIQVTDSEENEVAIVPLMDVVQARKK